MHSIIYPLLPRSADHSPAHKTIMMLHAHARAEIHQSNTENAAAFPELKPFLNELSAGES